MSSKYAAGAILAAVLTALGPAAAADPFVDEAGSSVRATIGAPAAQEPEQGDPLGQLRQRVAGERWQQRRETGRSPAESESPARQPFYPWNSEFPEDRPARQPLQPDAHVTFFSTAGTFVDAQPPPLPEVPEPLPTPTARPARELKPISEILPFADYEPDPLVRKEDPCRYLCPRPDGTACPPLGPEEMAPECPEEVPLGDGVYAGRSIAGMVFNWEATNLYHNPLYFEDPALERYGHTHHELVQPFVSAGRLGVQLLGLPYQMTIDPIHKRMYALGWYRPGECAPYKHYQIPLNCHAAAVEAGWITGAFFLFP